MQKLAAASHGYVGADISALCQEAAMCALRRHVAAQSLQQTVPEQPNHEAALVSPGSTEHVPARPEVSTSLTDAAKPPLQVWEQLSRFLGYLQAVSTINLQSHHGWCKLLSCKRLTSSTGSCYLQTLPCNCPIAGRLHIGQRLLLTSHGTS